MAADKRTVHVLTAVSLAIAGMLASASTLSTQAQRPPALLQDYIAFTVTAPPAALELDPFYKKYADAHGVPVVSSNKVPDAPLPIAKKEERNDILFIS